MLRNGEHQYAAFCCLAVSRCHQAMRNSTMEALSLIDAGLVFFKYRFHSKLNIFSFSFSYWISIVFNSGHIFWETEKETTSTNYFGFHEYAEEAQHCYLLAIKVLLLFSVFYNCLKSFQIWMNVCRYIWIKRNMHWQHHSTMKWLIVFQYFLSCKLSLWPFFWYLSLLSNITIKSSNKLI